MSARAALGFDPALAAHLVPAQRLEERRDGHDGRGRAATGIAPIDALLGGGWPRGALSELTGRRSSGRTALLLASLAHAIAAGDAVALVDGGARLDPRRAAACGVPLPHLLWIRCGGTAADRVGQTSRILKAADLVVAAGGFGLVALDLGELRPRVPAAAWVRLKHAAERQGTAVVVATPARLVGPVAAAALALSGEGGEGGGLELVAGGPPLLAALRVRAERQRGGHGGQTGDERCASLAFSCRS